MQNSSLIFSGYQDFIFRRSDEWSRLESTPLVEEIPLAISVNGISYAVMMVSPIDLDSFVVGFALSEGIIEHLSDIRDINTDKTRIQLDIESITINLEISSRRFAHFKQKKQAHLGATGCGLCGVESLAQAIPVLTKLAPSQSIKVNELVPLREKLSEHQVLGNKTGAIHAALLIDPDNQVICCMEDIGRHNTLDKVIGYALQNNIHLHNHNVLMSSRCSTELIQKAVRVGLSHLTHLASPSTLAVKLAKHYGLTLIHLPKKDAPRIFASSFKLEDIVDEQKR
ncbi:MAG: formate dehydrogenase accessory sulfurtransferase FdhD [Marinomonas colpomeniae]